MKISASTFYKYVFTASLKGFVQIINVNFKEDCVETSIKDLSNTALITTRLKKELFEDYNPVGNLIIRNTRDLLMYLKNYKKDVVELDKIEDYVLRMKSGVQEDDIVLGGKVIIEDQVHDGSKPIFDKVCSVSGTTDCFLVAAQKMNDSKSENVLFEKEGDVLTLLVGDNDSSDKLKTKISCEGVEGSFKSNIGKMFLNCSVVFDKNFPVVVELGNDIPITFVQNTDVLDFVCTIAPRINN